MHTYSLHFANHNDNYLHFANMSLHLCAAMVFVICLAPLLYIIHNLTP
ncbi:Uncharacterised protein [Vibrio cholerae]|nr:Uncharacterised protein [Vibrio cholerae]CSA77902.1 Uncharacterised protein [Vibrio cholerae]CSA82400.1 Uncharacterised protein [Vibrio cholerae]CSA83871.1 Uncharacterised protein [Vibrio cholerae]CSA87625.1 Uncharacterised protein [Vibrio cholerae]